MAKKTFDLNAYSVLPDATPVQERTGSERKETKHRRAAPPITPSSDETHSERIGLRLRPSVLAAAKKLAADRGISLSKLITNLLEQEILKNGK